MKAEPDGITISKFEVADISTLKPFPGNARRGNVAAIAESVRSSGVYRPVVVQDRTGWILAGNHVYEAARELGLERLPVVRVDVDDEAARRILLADNKLSDDASYDTFELVALLESLPTLDGTGFSSDELADLLASLDPARANADALGAETEAGTETDDVCPTCGRPFAGRSS